MWCNNLFTPVALTNKYSVVVHEADYHPPLVKTVAYLGPERIEKLCWE